MTSAPRICLQNCVWVWQPAPLSRPYTLLRLTLGNSEAYTAEQMIGKPSKSPHQKESPNCKDKLHKCSAGREQAA